MKNSVLLLSLFFWAAVAQAKEAVYFYDVHWMGVPAGKIKLLVRENPQYIYLRVDSRTIGMVRLLFPFRSTWECWCKKNGYPIRSKIYRQKGKKEVIKFFIFDQRRGLVWRLKKGKKKIKKYKLRHYPVYDELSGFVASTHLEWQEPGETKEMWIYAHKKANLTHITYLGEEKQKAFWGQVLAQKLSVRFGFESELVKRAKKARLWLYKGRVIKAEGDIVLGHLTVKLKKEVRNGLP